METDLCRLSGGRAARPGHQQFLQRSLTRCVHAQELESVLVGPVEMGINRFIFQGDCPDPSQIPKEDVVGVTVIFSQELGTSDLGFVHTDCAPNCEGGASDLLI